MMQTNQLSCVTFSCLLQVGIDWRQLVCRFGNETQHVHTISSLIAVCEVPAEVQMVRIYFT
jgi:hypothetical protein